MRKPAPPGGRPVANWKRRYSDWEIGVMSREQNRERIVGVVLGCTIGRAIKIYSFALSMTLAKGIEEQPKFGTRRVA